MKKFIFTAIISVFTLLPIHSYGAQQGNIYYVDKFIERAQAASSLLQSNTGANYSCGPTALLFVDNYFFMDMFGQPANYGTDLLLAVRQIGKVYKDLNRSYNTITNTTQLKNVVKNKWQWGTAVKASGNSSISTNLSSMVQRLKQDYPVILALESNYYNNPIPGYAHIVVFYKYDANAKKLYYFDPYYGGTHSVHYNEISSAIQGNLPYLRIAP